MEKTLVWINSHLIKYLLAGVLIIVPLFPKFPLISIPGTYVAIRFEDVILLLLGLIVFGKVIKNAKTLLKDEIVIAFLLFFGINLISLLSGILLTKTVIPHIGILNYVRRIEYLVPFFAVIVMFTNKQSARNLSYYIKILIIVIVVACIYGLGQRYLHFPIIITQNDQYSKGVALRWTSGSHISSTFAGHYDLAAFMVMVLPIVITLCLMLKKWENKIWLFISVGSGLWLLINSLSRIAQVSYLVAVGMALFFGRKFKYLFIVLIVSTVLVSFSSGLHSRFGRLIKVYYQKIVSAFVIHAEDKALPDFRSNLTISTPTPIPVFEDRSTSIRLNVEWPRAVRALSKNPLLGTGYSSIGLATDNDFLRMLGETGILGFASFVLIFLRIGKTVFKSILSDTNFSNLEYGFIVGMVGAIAGTLVNAFFIDIFEASKFATIFWLLTGYMVRLARIRLNEKTN